MSKEKDSGLLFQIPVVDVDFQPLEALGGSQQKSMYIPDNAKKSVHVLDAGASYLAIPRHFTRQSLMKNEAANRGVRFLPRQVMKPIYKAHGVWNN